MNTSVRCAFVQSQVACAMAEVAAMQAQNLMQTLSGLLPVYGHDDFIEVQNKYLIGHNAVIEYLRE